MNKYSGIRCKTGKFKVVVVHRELLLLLRVVLTDLSFKQLHFTFTGDVFETTQTKPNNTTPPFPSN